MQHNSFKGSSQKVHIVTCEYCLYSFTKNRPLKIENAKLQICKRIFATSPISFITILIFINSIIDGDHSIGELAKVILFHFLSHHQYHSSSSSFFAPSLMVITRQGNVQKCRFVFTFLPHHQYYLSSSSSFLAPSLMVITQQEKEQK